MEMDKDMQDLEDLANDNIKVEEPTKINAKMPPIEESRPETANTQAATESQTTLATNTASAAAPN